MSKCDTTTKRKRKFKSRSKAPLVSTCKACGNDYKPINANNTTFCSRPCKKWHHNNSYKYTFGPIYQPSPSLPSNAVLIVDKCACCENYTHVKSLHAKYTLCDNHKGITEETKLMLRKGPQLLSCASCSCLFCRMPGLGKGAGTDRTCGSIECVNAHAKSVRRSLKRMEKAKRRARQKGVESVSIDPIKVFERDKWICHICKRKTRKDKRGSTHPRAPELEHIVSLADNGSHTWGNVACSCRECNGIKGAKSYGQININIFM